MINSFSMMGFQMTLTKEYRRKWSLREKGCLILKIKHILTHLKTSSTLMKKKMNNQLCKIPIVRRVRLFWLRSWTRVKDTVLNAKVLYKLSSRRVRKRDIPNKLKKREMVTNRRRRRKRSSNQRRVINQRLTRIDAKSVRRRPILRLNRTWLNVQSAIKDTMISATIHHWAPV